MTRYKIFGFVLRSQLMIVIGLLIFAPRASFAQQSETEYRNESFADFLYLSCFEYDSLRHARIQFWAADTLDGRIHSNDMIHFWGNDWHFTKRVTTSSDQSLCLNDSMQFNEGCGFRKPINFPTRANEIREYNGIVPVLGTFNPDSITQLVLSGTNIYVRRCGPDTLSNGDIVIRCYPPSIAEAPAYPVPNSGAVFVNGKVWLSASKGHPDNSDGTFISEGFSGQLTIATSDTLIITDNLVYMHSRPDFTIPSTMDSCSDILGLVSEHFIMIGKDAPDTIYIHAALAAINGSISIQDIYENHAPGWNNEKYKLNIFGTLAQRYRGIIHTSDFPIGHMRGYISKNYRYDVRLQDNPPPYFPKTEDAN